MEEKIKKYAVQYAYDRGVHTPSLSMSNVVIVTDTNPITYEQAVSIFKGHLDDFKYRYKEEERPELVIWDDVGDGEFPNYGTELIGLDWRDDLEFVGDKIFKKVTTKNEINLPE